MAFEFLRRWKQQRAEREIESLVALLPDSETHIAVERLVVDRHFLDLLYACSRDGLQTVLTKLGQLVCRCKGPDVASTIERLVMKPPMLVGDEFDNWFIGEVINRIITWEEPAYDELILSVLTAERCHGTAYGHRQRNFLADHSLITQRLDRLPPERRWEHLLALALFGGGSGLRGAESFYNQAATLIRRTKSEEWPSVCSILARITAKPRGQINLDFVYHITDYCAEAREPKMLPMLASLASLSGSGVWTIPYEWEDAGSICYVGFERLPFCMAVYFHLAAHLGLYNLVFEHLSDSPFKTDSSAVAINERESLIEMGRSHQL